jgi:hypothetical protein
VIDEIVDSSRTPRLADGVRFHREWENLAKAVASSRSDRAGKSSPIGTDPRALQDARARARQSRQRLARRFRAARPLSGLAVRRVDRPVLHRHSGAVSRSVALSARAAAGGIGRRLGLALCRWRDRDGLSLGTDRFGHPDDAGSGLSRIQPLLSAA